MQSLAHFKHIIYHNYLTGAKIHRLESSSISGCGTMAAEKSGF